MIDFKATVAHHSFDIGATALSAFAVIHQYPELLPNVAASMACLYWSIKGGMSLWHYYLKSTGQFKFNRRQCDREELCVRPPGSSS